MLAKPLPGPQRQAQHGSSGSAPHLRRGVHLQQAQRLDGGRAPAPPRLVLRQEHVVGEHRAKLEVLPSRRVN